MSLIVGEKQIRRAPKALILHSHEIGTICTNCTITPIMADGSEVLAPIFLGTIRFPELDEDVAEMVGVTISVLGDLALIGQSILRRFSLTLDHGRQVILEP
jgi:hypothetical protein